MRKYEPSNEQIKEHEIYKRAEATAKALTIPEFSEQTEDYLKLINEYDNTIRGFSTWGMFHASLLTNYTEDGVNKKLEEFNSNLQELDKIIEQYNHTKDLHAKIIEAIKNGTHATYEKESEARGNAITAKREITWNAYNVVKEILIKQNKQQQKKTKTN